MTEEERVANPDNTMTLVFELDDGDNVEVTLTREEYDNIVWSAGRANMNIEQFINEVLKKEIERMRQEEDEGGEEDE